MYRIKDIKLPVGAGKDDLVRTAAGILRMRETDILDLCIHRRSLDARKKPDLFYIYTVDVETGNRSLKKRNGRHNQIMSTPDESYQFPVPGKELLKDRPVVIGSGPAGLFAAYLLAKCGYRPLILERGGDV